MTRISKRSAPNSDPNISAVFVQQDLSQGKVPHKLPESATGL
jgi:hypothetical protein